MLRPDELIEYPDVDLKLGIKSSLPNVRATLALLMMLWKSNDDPTELTYSKENGESIGLTDEVRVNLIQKYSNLYSSVGVSDEQFVERVNNNQLFKSQLESLIVAFELIWRVAKITFHDNMPASTERKGGKRYPKTLIFTKNMDIIDILLSSDDEEYSKVLLSWIGIDITVKTELEVTLLKLLVFLSEEAVYKLVDNNKDVKFNMNSVYIKLLENASAVDINGSEEAKGPLRILKSLLTDNMNPYLTYTNAKGVSVATDMQEKLENYQGRLDASLSLSNTKYIIEMEEDSGGNEFIKENFDEYLIEKSRIEGGTNVLLYGVPGTGKSWTIEQDYCKDESRMERLVFHPDYTYSDFVGQILPSVSEENVRYEFTPGPFTSLLKKAYENPEFKYFLIIEEINRGNAPAIFGEVFQLLDRKTVIREVNDDGFAIGTSEYGITNADIAKVVYDNPSHKIRIPSNLSIIGTMNTSDQNVFTLDTAFQRRWNMRMIENNFDNVDHNFANQSILDTDTTWERFCTEINNIILDKNVRMTSSEDKRLGVYFVQLSDLIYDENEENKALTDDERKKAKMNNSRFPEKVLKYLWDDAFKFSRGDIFEINQYNSLESIVKEFTNEKGNNRFKIFKENIYDAFVPSEVEGD